MIAIFSPAGELSGGNQQLFDYFRRPLEEVSRWATNGIAHSDDLQNCVDIFQAAMVSGQPYNFEARFRRFDGVYRWLQIRGLPLCDSNGTIVRWYGLVTDVEDRKQWERELEASEINLRLTIDTIPALAWSARPDGTADFLNQHYLDYVGRTLDQLCGWQWASVVHPDDLPILGDAWGSFRSAGRGGEVEARVRRHDGVYRWFLFRANPLRDELGNIVKWYGVNADIEDRKQAEIQLAREKALLEMIASGLPLRDTLEALCRFFEAAHPDCQCIVHPSDWTGPTFEHGVSPFLPASSPILSRDGRVLGTFSIQRGDPGPPSSRQQEYIAHVVQIASIAIERSRAEAALRRSETFLAEGQRISATGSFLWRVATDELTFSEELKRIFEFEPGVQVTFERIQDRVYPEDLPALAEKMADVRAGRDNAEYGIRLCMPDNGIKYVRVFGRVIHHHDGSLECLGAVQDVTLRALAEKALDKARSELAHVSRVMSLGALTASIVHEVSQPLAGIITNAGTCLRMLAVSPPNVEGALETARRTIRDGNRASEVVARLRSLFAKEAAKSEQTDLNEAAAEVVALLSSDLQRNRVTVQTYFASDLPPISADRVQLQQVVLNLLTNASDAMNGVCGRQRLAILRTEREGGAGVRLSVQDGGVGFPPEHAEQLFQAFHTTKSNGMGIGLSVSRSIIESHGGRLWGEANPSGGATFAFSIPAIMKDGQTP